MKVIYKVFVNRDADPDGLTYWQAKLEGEAALTRVELMKEFCNSKEYKDYQDMLKKGNEKGRPHRSPTDGS